MRHQCRVALECTLAVLSGEGSPPPLGHGDQGGGTIRERGTGNKQHKENGTNSKKFFNFQLRSIKTILFRLSSSVSS